MALGIDPTVDYAFKRLFGDPNHLPVLKHLLNAVFEGQFVVDSVEISSPFLEREFEEDKLSVLDLRVRDTYGRQYNLEMQSTITPALTSRLVYYLAEIYSSQLFDGNPYEKLVPAYCICFVNQVYFRESPQFHTRFRLASIEHQLVFSDQIEVHWIELPKYRGSVADLPSARAVEKWVYFMSHAADLDRRDIQRMFQDPAFDEAGGILEMISKTPDERLQYKLRMKSQRDQISSIAEAKRMGLEAGREEGMQKGREEGMQEGREAGERIGRVRLLQELLGDPLTGAEELATWDLGRLQTLVESLQSRLRARQQP